MKNNSQTIFIVIAVLVVLGVAGYFLFNKEDEAPEGLVSQNTGTLATPLVSEQSDASLARNELLILLQSVSGVSLDTSLLDAGSFTGLKDIGILLPPVSSQGRVNPFAPYTGTTVQIIEQPIIADADTAPVDDTQPPAEDIPEGGDTAPDDSFPLF
ncbi:MAG: hypothetical protein K9M36_00100 [Candidatus Pacebacteria bacterium]|nr:hypothetical protein [Candidatus Paceibacterota bacterium]